MNWPLSKTVIAVLVLATPAYAESPGSTQLTTEEIRQAFSGVRDDARVQDEANTRAVNFWCANGVFTTEWSNGERSGKVVGRWRAIDNQRCVTILSGLGEPGDKERCGPILRRGEHYLSVNPDGSIHGVHSLSAITAADIRAKCLAAPDEPAALL
jgi:hypothetical protein